MHSDRINNKDAASSSFLLQQRNRFKKDESGAPKTNEDLKQWIESEVNQVKDLLDGEDSFFSLNDMQILLQQQQAKIQFQMKNKNKKPQVEEEEKAPAEQRYDSPFKDYKIKVSPEDAN